MTEHVHEWAVDHQILPDVVEGTDIHYGECFAYCGCGAELRCHEIQSLLNATERLSAEDAREIERYVKYAGDQAPELSAYADTLEDK